MNVGLQPDLRAIEKSHEAEVLRIADTIARSSGPTSPYVLAARDAFQQASSAIAQARAADGPQRFELLNVGQAFAAAGAALARLGDLR